MTSRLAETRLASTVTSRWISISIDAPGSSLMSAPRESIPTASPATPPAPAPIPAPFPLAVVAAHDLHAGVSAADAQRGFAAVAAMRADGADVFHLPGPGLVAIGTRGERADRADVNAHAALFALQMIFLVGRDDRAGAPVLDPQRPDVHAFAANPNAAIAQDATRTVEVHHRRPLLLVAMVLHVHELRLGRAVLEGHVLQFAF